jgi:beta-lactamase superfamily II metal-dependent hydrolase
MSRKRIATAALALGILGATIGVAAPARAAVPDAPHCSTSGTWRQNELNVYWFDVEQGDSQLVVGPTGKTLLIDLGESSFNTTGANTHATAVAAKIRAICGIASGPVHLDYVMASHHHLDHIGYSHVPGDTTNYGQGLYQLLTPTSTGGLGFTVGQLIDHDGGRWVDQNSNNQCEPGTSTDPSNEVVYDNAGTTSATSARFICWLYGPAGQADRANIEGKVFTLTNTNAWTPPDLGAGVTSSILEANAKDVMQANGTTPVSGDHHLDTSPPSENDYSIGLKVVFGPYAYVTAGDSDGEYATSADGYTYNNVEALLKTRTGSVNTLRANHHGSGHSSSDAYVTTANPQTGVISCGVNSYGHPANRTLNAFRAVGADIYLLNNPCDDIDTTGAAIDYSGTFNHNGDIHLATSNAGASFDVTYDGGTRSYTTRGSQPPPPASDASAIRVNEYLMAPSTGNEWIELYNPTASAIAIGGLYVDDLVNGGGAPKQIPVGTTIPAFGRWVDEFPSGFLNNTGTDYVRFLAVNGGVETVYDTTSYTLGSTQYDKVFHRVGDGGSWCATISTNVSKGTANPATCP